MLNFQSWLERIRSKTFGMKRQFKISKFAYEKKISVQKQNFIFCERHAKGVCNRVKFQDRTFSKTTFHEKFYFIFENMFKEASN
jgi:hypothetical protein